MPQNIFNNINDFQLVKFTKGYRVEDFFCDIKEYSDFLQKEVQELSEISISQTHILINKANADIVAYITLLTGSLNLDKDQKREHELEIPFSSVPALKIGKLAVDKNYRSRYKNIGSLMIQIARGIAFDLNKMGVACRFITVDADISNNPTIVDFYLKNNFKLNQELNLTKRTIGMRLDIFHES